MSNIGSLLQLSFPTKPTLLTKNDTIVAVLSNSIEAVVVLLAAASIGAIFSSTAPDMGAAGIVSRYAQIRPKIMFVDTEVLYAGKRRVLRQKMTTAVTQLRKQVPELTKVVVVTGSVLPDNGWYVRHVVSAFGVQI